MRIRQALVGIVHIGKPGVGFSEAFCVIRGRALAGNLVRVELDRHLAIGALDGGSIGPLIDTEPLVVVVLGRRSLTASNQQQQTGQKPRPHGSAVWAG